MTPPSAEVPSPGDSFADEGVALLRERSSVQPVVGLVLGSGLGDAVVEDIVADAEVAFEALPGFPPSSVPGHAGRLVLGELYDVPVAVFRGRIHFYEGHGIAATTLIPRLCAGLGVRTLVLTNAAGCLDPTVRPGTLMVIDDHMNFLGVNPLSGWRFPDGRPAFVDLSRVYDPDLSAAAEEAAGRAGVAIRRGVYAALPGPSFETAAETRFLTLAGADAVGMSTVPEAVAAVALGLRVQAISCLTNVAGADSSHEDVLAAARGATLDLRAILAGVLPVAAGRVAPDHA